MASIADRPVSRILENPWLTIALVCGAITSTVLIGAAIYGQGRGLGLDFNVFWRAGRTPLDHVYDANPFDPFIYPPPSLVWIKPFSLLPFWPALLAFWAVSLALYGYAAQTRSWLLFASPVVVQCLIFGQTSVFLAAFALLAARQDGWKRGALLALVFSTKPQLAILVPLVLLARREWAALAGLAIVGLAEIAISAALFGPGLWIEWAKAFPAFSDTVATNDLWGVMITPYAYAMRLGINPWPVFAIGVLLALFTAIWSRRGNAIEVGCLCSLLATPYAVANDLAVLLPFALARLLGKDSREKPWAALIYSTAFPPVALAWGAVRQLRSTGTHRRAPR